MSPSLSSQLEHARITQTELMRESFRHNQEMSELLQKQDELQDRLSEEARAREELALELHRAEGECPLGSLFFKMRKPCLYWSFREKLMLYLSVIDQFLYTP